jgi:isopentenyldiphosphate isomerase
MPKPPIAIVDDEDTVIGAATKEEAWREGLRHRVVRIVLEDGQGNMLVQMRSKEKTLFPSRWDTAAAGHVDADDTDYDEAARRELEEEIGLRGIPLEEIGYYKTDGTDGTWRQLKRFVKVYRAMFTGMPVKFAKDEVESVSWMPIAELKKMVKERPELVSDGIEEVITRFY